MVKTQIPGSNLFILNWEVFAAVENIESLLDKILWGSALKSYSNHLLQYLAPQQLRFIHAGVVQYYIIQAHGSNNKRTKTDN